MSSNDFPQVGIGRPFTLNRLRGLSVDEMELEEIMLEACVRLTAGSKSPMSASVVIMTLVDIVGLAALAVLDEAGVYGDAIIRLAVAAGTPDNAAAAAMLHFLCKRPPTWLLQFAEGEVTLGDSDWLAAKKEVVSHIEGEVTNSLKGTVIAAAENLLKR